MKFNYKSYSDHLESENERLNGIIDELEDLNEDYLTENFLLNVKINKAIDYIKSQWLGNEAQYIKMNYDEIDISIKEMHELLKILGDKENE